MTEYQGLIQSLRNSTSYIYRNGVRVTSYTNHGQNADLIPMMLTDQTNGGQVTITLWFTADNLYLRGFTNAYGETFYFYERPDQYGNPGYNLATAFLTRGPGFGPAGYMSQLGYGGGYNVLIRAGGLPRANLSLSWGNFYSYFYTLAHHTSGGNSGPSATALTLMIQYFSEAARFTDIYGFISANVNSYNADFRLPSWQQNLENSWSRISDFAISITNNPSEPPLFVPGIDRNNTGASQPLYTFADVQALMAVLLNAGEINNPAMGGYYGDWNYAQI